MTWIARLRGWSLTWKMSLLIVVLVYGISMLTTSLLLGIQWFHMEQQLRDQASSFSHAVAFISSPHLVHQDYWQAYEEIQALATIFPDSTDMTVTVLDINNRVFASNHPERMKLLSLLDVADWPASGEILVEREQERLRLQIPVFGQGIEIGKVLLSVSLSAVFYELRTSMFYVVLVVMAVSLLGGLVGVLLGRRLTKPLNAMAAAVPWLERGETDALPEITVYDEDEVGRLVRLFNRMVAELAERKRLEKMMSQAERLSAMGRLAVAAAHEIRNPLAGALNSLNTLEKFSYDPDVRGRSVKTIRAGLTAVQQIVNGMLGYSREQIQPSHFTRQHFEEAKALLMTQTHADEVLVRWVWQAGADVSLPAAAVRQLLHNLGLNAIQASQAGAEVVIELEQQENTITLRVCDQGCGLSEELKDRIFDPFWSDKPGGTGLGLWVVARIVAEYGGMIRVESELGKGTCVELLFSTDEQDIEGGKDVV